MAAAHKLWPQVDLAIGIGTRMELARWRWPRRPDAFKSIRIDIDPAEMRRFPADVAVVADAQDGARDLVAAVRRCGYVRQNGRRATIRDASENALKQIQSVQPQMSYLNVLREVLPADAIVTDEMSQVGFTSWFGFPVYEPRTFLSSGYQGNLGSGFPTALGAKVAYPDRPVVAITGDGGFMFGVQELATAVQFNIGVITLVFNNNAFANVRRDQVQSFGGRIIGSDLVNPDFVKLAESFGVQARRASSPTEFRLAIERALAHDAPQLIVVDIAANSETSPWPFISPQS
jgi:acetolactate synthase-1/2/3 large subunit